MNINPIDVFTNVASLFLPGVNFLFMLSALFGTWIGYRATYDLFRHVKGDQVPGMMPKDAILPCYFLAGALIVVPVILWRGAKTFVLGGNRTYSIFSYLPNTQTGSTCGNLSNSLTELCMLIGTISIFTAGRKAYVRVTRPEQGIGSGGAITYFVAGIFLFFITDANYLLSKTAGVMIGMPAICKALGEGTGQ
ncbi:hypothetical protein [Acetobacter persici]|uniref:hypothetical protein n=1 Tax=Acetobacter persici TaxID=1076596 RepID=UPI0005BD4CDC|nr:hypothetical protein [Acetobacter persici]MCG0998930.1 hypothetical protein [Acetobacter persici]